MVLCLLTAGWPASATASGDGAGSLVFATSSDQLSKPHRLTWFAEGSWWGVFRKSGGEGSGWRVWRRDQQGSWSYGPEVLSTMGADRFDVFREPASGRVFAHHLGATEANLLRLEYDAGHDMYLTAARSPVPTAYGGQASSLTVDTVGRVWIATHPGDSFAYTVRDAETLGQLAPLTVLPEAVAPESLVVGRFVDDRGPAVGFIYSTPRPSYEGRFKVQRDADPIGSFSTEAVASNVDNHSTFAAAGRDVVAVWKDQRDIAGEPIVLVRRRLPDGTWGAIVPVFDAKSSTSSGNHTRPRIALDTATRRVHVAAAELTADALEIHERVAGIDSLEFGPQQAIFRSGDQVDGYRFRDVHAGQEPATAASGLLWLARGREVKDSALGTFSLWEHLRSPSPDPPTAPAGLAITSPHGPVDEGATVHLTASVTGSSAEAAAVDWGDGTQRIVPIDGSTIAATHRYLDDGDYTIRVALEGGEAAATIDQRVRNVAPTITGPSEDLTLLVGERFTYPVTFDDPGVLDEHTVTVDFGDGQRAVAVLEAGARATTIEHAYGEAGRFTITATVTDGDGGEDALAVGAEVADPEDPGAPGPPGGDPGPFDPPPDPLPPEDPGPGDPAAVTYLGSRVANSGPTTALTVSRPDEAQLGDTLLASVTLEGRPTITAPPGWVLLRSDRNANALTTATYLATLGSDPPATYRWNFSTATSAAVQLLAYRGLDPDAPIISHGATTTGPQATALDTPRLTPTEDGHALAIFNALADTTITVPAPLQTRTHHSHPGVLTAAASDLPLAAGTTTAYTATLATPARGTSQLFLLRPARR